MTLRKFLFAIQIILITIAGLFILPDFSFQLGDQTVRWVGLDHDLWGDSFIRGDFTRGAGIYPSTRYVYDITTDANPQAVADIVERRMQVAGIDDWKLALEQGDGFARLSFNVPANSDLTVVEAALNLLLSRGEISFLESAAADNTTVASDDLLSSIFGDYKPIDSTFTIADITGISIETRHQFGGSVWKLNLTPAGVQKILIAESTQEKPMVVVIDNIPQFYLLDVRNSAANDPVLIGVPLGFSGSTLETRILASYITDRYDLADNYSGLEPNVVPASYALGGRVLLAISMLALVLGSAFVITRGLSMSQRVELGWSFLWAAVVGVAMLKAGQMSISTGTIIGVGLMLVIQGFSLRRVVMQYKELGNWRLLFLWLFVISAIALRMDAVWGEAESMLGVVSLLSFVFVVGSYTAFKSIHNFYSEKDV